jgi:DNA polymerase-3 subunit delta'
MSLKGIFCQDKAISVLQRAYAAGKMPHAYIFAGLDGVGKFRTAREWAKMLLCNAPIAAEHQDGEFADSCGSCESCRLFEAGSHPDFHHVYKELIEFTKEGKGRKTPVKVPIDVIREFLIEKVSTRPTLSQRKLFVVSEAEKLNVSSQNALLKVLEEPPGYCTIVLLCTRMERLLSTTKSRCQIIRFGPIDEDRISDTLKQMGLEDKQAGYFARLAQGSLGTACQWAELELAGAELYRTKKELISSLSTLELADAVSLAQQFLEQSKRIAAAWTDLDTTTSKSDLNRRAQKGLIQIIISALHDAMQLNVAPEQEPFNFDQKESVKRLAGRFDAEQAAERIAGCYRTLRWIEAGVNEKLVFEQLLLNLTGPDIMAI